MQIFLINSHINLIIRGELRFVDQERTINSGKLEKCFNQKARFEQDFELAVGFYNAGKGRTGISDEGNLM